MESILSAELSYLVGFAQTDGNLYQNTRNRGRFSIELSTKDIDILYKLQQIIPCVSKISTRVRKTNFKDSSNQTTLSINDLTFRTFINKLGAPYGKKSEIIDIPPVSFSERDYWRGVIDGDGSLGYDARGNPFISLITSSESLARQFEKYINKTVGLDKHTNRNKRDKIFNIKLTTHNAQILANNLYYDGCLGLNRKIGLAYAIRLWQEPPKTVQYETKQKLFTPEDDEIVLSFGPSKAAKILNRSPSSVQCRKARLLGKWIYD